MKRRLLLALSLACVVLVRAQAAYDSTEVHRPHELNSIEVLGVKQMPSTGFSPVTRISRAEISRLGISAVKDAGMIVPNFYTPSYGSRMTSSIYMRGLGSRIDQAVMGLTVDGVPVLNKDVYDFDICDISRMEVLRGAQSVLNGRNAMAGQINIYTLSPRDYQGVRASVGYGRFDNLKANVGGYFRLAPGLYSALTAQFQCKDGAYRNEYNGSRVGSEEGGALRWKTVYAPGSSLSVTNTVSMSIDRQHGYPYESVLSGRIAYNDTCFYRRNSFADGLTVAWAGKRVVVTSLSSVQYLDDNMTLDQDFTPEDYFTLTQRRHELTVTEDLFAKGSRGAYSWLGGVFGFWRRSRMDAPVTFYDAGISNLIESKRNEMNPYYPISWDDREFLLSSRFRTVTGGFALYHESRYKVGSFTLEAGLRWEIERVACRYQSDADASYTTWQVLDDGSREYYMDTPVSIHDSGKLRRTFNELLPKIGVSYEHGDFETYLSFTKGYKSGGFNTQMFSDVLQQRVMETMGIPMVYDIDDIVGYEPESSYNYECGVRYSGYDGRLRGEAVGFFIDCHDQQLTVFPPGLVTGRIMTNAGRTYSCGVELSGSYMPTDDITLRASYGYTHAVFHRYDDGRNDYSGKRVPYAPSHTAFVSGAWRMPVKIGSFTPGLNVNFRGVGDIMWNELNTLHQPFYVLAGASVTLSSPMVSFKIWGENLTCTRYSCFYFLSMGNSFVQRGNPMTFGASVSFNVGLD